MHELHVVLVIVMSWVRGLSALNLIHPKHPWHNYYCVTSWLIVWHL